MFFNKEYGSICKEEHFLCFNPHVNIFSVNTEINKYNLNISFYFENSSQQTLSDYLTFFSTFLFPNLV